MKIQTSYHLFVNEYALQPNLRARLFKDDVCAATHVDADFWIGKMAQPLLAQNYAETWDREFRYQETDKAGEEKVLYVHGSEFVRLFFAAIFRFMNDWMRIRYCTCNPFLGRAPFLLDETPLEKRLEAFTQMAGGDTKICPKPLKILVETNDVKMAQTIVSHLQSKIDGHGVFALTFQVIGFDAEERADLRILLIKQESEVYVSPEQSLCFVLNPKLQINDVLKPSGIDFSKQDREISQILRLQQTIENGKVENEQYCWLFNRLDSLLTIICTYVKSQLLAPAFARLCAETPRSSTSVEWLRLGRVFPFTVVACPQEVVVDDELRIRVHHASRRAGGLPCVSVTGYQPTVTEISDCETELLLRTNSLTPVRIVHNVSPYEKAWPSEWRTECVFMSCEDGRCEQVSVGLHEHQVAVLNHGLTTDFDLKTTAEATGENAYRVKTHEEFLLTVRASNKYDLRITPKDADDFQIKAPEGLRVSSQGNKICLEAEKPGHFDIEVAYANGRCAAKAVRFAAFDVATSLHYEIRSVPKKGHPPFAIKYDKGGDAHFKCFPGDEFTLQAWLEGPSEPLWESRIAVDGLKIEPWGDKAKVHRIMYASAGDKSFSLAPADGSLPPRTVTCKVLVNYSDIFLKTMVVGTALVAFLAWFIYGLSLWAVPIYLFPLVTYGLYFGRRFPMHRAVMFVLFVWDLFMAAQAVWEEIA